MTVDTKGFVSTSNKDIFKVCSIVEKSLASKMMAEAGAERWPDMWKLEKKYTYPKFELNSFGLITAVFRFRAESRRMSIIFGYDGDYSEFKKGKKIILSLGAWGSSVELMETVLKALSNELKAKAYIDENDCDSEDFREVK